MKKIYHLSTCSTCKRIISELGDTTKIDLQDIKTEKITKKQIEEMANLAGSYLALFSKRAMKYRSMGLHEMKLTEEDLCNYILEEYTFLKRPVMIFDDQIFIGNSKKVVSAAKAYLDK